MKTLFCTAIALATLSGPALALPTINMLLPASGGTAGPGLGGLAPSTFNLPLLSSIDGLLPALGLPTAKSPASNTSPHTSVAPPVGGTNIGGHGANGGHISTNVSPTANGGSVGASTTLKADGRSVVSVPPGSSVTVTGENGGVGHDGNQGNGGNITITNSQPNGNEVVTTQPGDTAVFTPGA